MDPILYTQVVETRYIYACGICHEDTPGLWRDAEEFLIPLHELNKVRGRNLVFWKNGRVVEKATQEFLIRRRGFYKLLVHADNSITLHTVSGNSREFHNLKKSHICDDDE